MKNPDFIDAQALSILHPDTFLVPTLRELSVIAVGDYVKVGVEGERFWVQIRSAGTLLVGKVDNDPVFTRLHGLQCGDTVGIERRAVMDILKPNLDPTCV